MISKPAFHNRNASANCTENPRRGEFYFVHKQDVFDLSLKSGIRLADALKPLNITARFVVL